ARRGRARARRHEGRRTRALRPRRRTRCALPRRPAAVRGGRRARPTRGARRRRSESLPTPVSLSPATPTAEFASLVYGPGGVPFDDPAETFHEASSLYPGVAPGRLPSLLELSRNPALQETVARASVTRDHLPGTDLPP